MGDNGIVMMKTIGQRAMGETSISDNLKSIVIYTTLLCPVAEQFEYSDVFNKGVLHSLSLTTR